MHKLSSTLFILLSFLFLFGLSGCLFQSEVAKAERQAGQDDIAFQKEMQVEYETLVKRHLDQQSDESKKLMKKMKRKSGKTMQWRRRSWFRENF
jgi:hypothetical protein